MGNMVPSLVFPGMHTHTHIYIETNTFTHTVLNLFSMQSIELPVDREQLAAEGRGGGYKPSTSPAGISFCKMVQLNFPRWQLLCSEDRHLGHNYLDFFSARVEKWY